MLNLASYCQESLNDCSDYTIKLKERLSSLVPRDSLFTLDAIECGIYALNDIIECHLDKKLKWDKIIDLFGNFSTEIQLELIQGTADDTDVRERILSDISLYMTGMAWPEYRDTETHRTNWKEKFYRELTLYMRSK